MKAQLVMMATLVLLGCASADNGAHDLALTGAVKPGAREALQQQLGSPNCRTNAHREATRLADTAVGPATDVAFVVGLPPDAAEKFAQLDDPTRDWTREQATGSNLRCPPAGRKHRNFA